MNSLNFSSYNLPFSSNFTPLKKILKGALKDSNHNTSPLNEVLYWDASFLGLDQVSIFQEANQSEQFIILQKANRDLLEEIYWVEHAGVGYMSKMLLLADSREERMLYSLFAADEATHLSQIQTFLDKPPIFNGDTFLAFMGEIVESFDKALLMTLVQLVLEGWGFSHYRSLAKGCLQQNMATTLRGFLEAESRHHAAGVVTLQEWDYTPESLESIYYALTEFLQMVQYGPQRLLNAIEQGKGYLSRTNKVQILEELQTEIYSQQRLDLLRFMMTDSLPPSVLQRLDEQDSFKPFSAQQCV
ncbi:ferritin-like domain-containing protein [Picosynechococcus sp. PCC 7117]|uniref:ferritin-like domain-containing protein n=1 Tax=Picosynechococcus sp. PCC 7117 TaxID=195498 RepID=UPI000810BD02|nr:ferritin-like domain-containing protein [Picosynechococcus sp. PCC 7117]ANV87194.1 hypothetical protein AWQ22_06805 [Picosynechococcus sp. PCC 7117]